MPLLDATLAFALTLALLATLVTTGLEIIQRALRLRVTGFRKMLEGFYDDELSDYVKVKLATRLQPDLTADQVKAMSEEELARAGLKEEVAKARSAIIEELQRSKLAKSRLGGVFMRELTDLEPLELLRRLGETEVFKDLQAKADAELAEVLDSLTRRYEAYTAAARDFFGRRAKVLSIVGGILLALFANVDGLAIMRAYLENESLRAETIASMDEIGAVVEERQEALRAATEEGAPEDQAAEAQAVRDLYGALGERLDAVRNSGLPVGYGFAPAALRGTEGELLLPSALFAAERAGDAWLWLARVLLTGVLIGLGAPFWFDVAKRLAQVRKMLRPEEETKPLPTPEAAAATARTTQRKTALVEAFRSGATKPLEA